MIKDAVAKIPEAALSTPDDLPCFRPWKDNR
jgi:hypothetical protein